MYLLGYSLSDLANLKTQKRKKEVKIIKLETINKNPSTVISIS